MTFQFWVFSSMLWGRRWATPVFARALTSFIGALLDIGKDWYRNILGLPLIPTRLPNRGWVVDWWVAMSWWVMFHVPTWFSVMSNFFDCTYNVYKFFSSDAIRALEKVIFILKFFQVHSHCCAEAKEIFLVHHNIQIHYHLNLGVSMDF